MKTVLVTLTALLLGVAQAEVAPKRGTYDGRLRTAFYSANEVYRITGFVGYALDIEFAPDESFVGLSAGDPEAVTYAAHENVLTLRPKAASSRMNLSVTTSKHRYYFDYTITSHLAAPDELMYVVHFTYPAEPQDHHPTVSPAERIDQELKEASALRPRNFDYWFCGDAAVKPLAASDDGVHTRLTFAPRAELPAIFVRNEDGSESLLNFNVDAGDVVIHRIAARFVVRRGRLTGCIVNKGFLGSSDRLDSGTIAPSVMRKTRELQ